MNAYHFVAGVWGASIVIVAAIVVTCLQRGEAMPGIIASVLLIPLIAAFIHVVQRSAK